MLKPAFVAAVISPDLHTHDAIAAAFEEHSIVETLWFVREYPEFEQLQTIKEAPGGCVVLLDFLDPRKARAIASVLDQCGPTVVTVAIIPPSSPQNLLELMQLGIREVVAAPLESMELIQAVTRAARKLPKGPGFDTDGGQITSFMPAKPGCGATTLASNVAAAVARLSERRTLLTDFDLRLGMTSFLFKLHGEHSVMDALVASHRLELTLWDSLVCRRGHLDVLGSAPAEFGREIKESGATDVLNFARALYPTIIVDLPGDMRAYELEILQCSKEIFLVCSSDIGSLHLAKRKAEMLRSLGLGEGLSVIMNRVDGRRTMSISDIEEILQAPVRFHVSYAVNEIAEAVQNGAAIEGRSPIAIQIENIAKRIASGAAPAVAQVNERRFIDFFSITRVREAAGRRR